MYRMPKRTRTIQWEDPQISSRDTKNISGLDYLCAIRDGNIAPAPAANLVGYHIVNAVTGQAVFELKPSEYHYNPFSTVHGGMLSTLLDTAMAAAVMTVLPAGKACSTLELKVSFIRPVSSRTGPVTAKANIIHAGNRIATVEGRLFDGNEKLYAHATSTCLIVKI
ncbi:MAG: PaaI family thioesterase [Deltaproteobacteria bacterium]|nr:MAG: PaaI family thioesterase [Deltaproteobacteria bacterium]RLC17895.1 MAG: PaaI family thioesterase [Deltaproteobacteria bacterium]